jgi:hypothetical protein
MCRIPLRLVAFYVFTLAVLGCGTTSDSTPSQTGLTDDERTWCSQHPEAHGEAASALGIPFLGDYIRASKEAGGPDITGLEPPFLAVPSGNDEALVYRLQFENSDDSDRACRAAIDSVN